ncbi:Fur family transcriptional regulator [uncultured Roseobacter sp.]|uniref:Fur family transcriptional regulator n=1 Tax=uncultured Roseobacter sp. TaxID=114847 RepID=UPI00262BD668|nr:Fur family transcriptional regulator [uncultured Roseobacter sp.]
MRKRAAARQSDVLSVLDACDRPMTAYQILEKLQENEPDIAPPTVYRTLSALTDQGRAHRLESKKAFVPCRCRHVESVPVLAICQDCGSVDEHDGSALLPRLTALTDNNAFRADRHIVEIHGRCGACAASTA